MRTRFAIIGRGFAGWHAAGVQGENSVSVSGAELRDTPWPHGGVKRGLLNDAPAGTPVYDAAHLEAMDAGSAFVAWVCSHGASGYTPELTAQQIASLRAAVPGVRFGVVRGRGQDKRIEWEPDNRPLEPWEQVQIDVIRRTTAECAPEFVEFIDKHTATPAAWRECREAMREIVERRKREKDGNHG